MPIMTSKKMMINGIPTIGRITIHTTPTTPMVQAIAGRQETQHAMALTALHNMGPMQGMQSVATSRGPANKQKAIHAKAKPTNLNAQVMPLDSALCISHILEISIVPILKSFKVYPEQSQSSGATQSWIVPITFFPSTDRATLFQLLPLKRMRMSPIPLPRPYLLVVNRLPSERTHSGGAVPEMLVSNGIFCTILVGRVHTSAIALFT
mmetsp:Transcript_28874/g.62760  ORF Transcript_28874/g.62760 Transcript_28874/m.62760 type:complete len:208 (+) Transcript_28874:371-994(+)